MKKIKYSIRKEHKEQIERWANYVRDNPQEWKAKLKPFIDGQIIMARRFYNKLAETSEGREKIKLIKSNVKLG
ncbi:hypothetical protein COU56_02010 [Candidatus Pacearchaeota archaeon CG10_big_fil_rev_8_21_14_0_10_31_9]|nr:MAG: hypothetical protein AUJ62_03595 [Candidatus Pacearchaeota archaeon CG1_02_32_21]PIN95330.1 MAG: hypothetical protein COU56_02010 [Candidatus Pacearchaeota archaeon CG10_big_fil_rev_8_21_14_0_10_31_9]